MQQLMGGKKRFRKPTVKMIVDLAFASNVRFLDDHELYLDNVDLYRVNFFNSNAGHKTILGPKAQGWFCVQVGL